MRNKKPGEVLPMEKKDLFLIFVALLFIVFPVQSLEVTDKGVSYISWSWNETGITTISIDGKTVSDIDTTANFYILSDLDSDSLHTIKISNESYNAVSSVKTDKNTGDIVNLYIYFFLGIACIFAGIFIPIIGLGACLFAIIGIGASVGNSFIMAFLFFVLLIAGILESVSSIYS